MKLGDRCTTCGDSIDTDDVLTCEVCGRDQHDACREYETTFECQQCGDESWLGAIEF